MLDPLWSLMTEQFGENEFLQGGFLLGLLGTLAVWLRRVPGLAWDGLKRVLIVECDIQQRDEAFKAMVDWLAVQPYGKRVKRFSATVQDEDEDDDPLARGRRVVLSPAPGNHLLPYRGRWVRVHRGREKQTAGSDDLFAGFYESFTLQTLGRNRQVLESLVKDAVALREQRSVGRTRVLYMDKWGNWEEIALPRTRPLDSVILPDDEIQRVASDAENFLTSEQTYAERGIPYRRGYLLHGPPGTGKSSLCMAIAGHLGLDVAALSLSNPDLNDGLLALSLSRAPRRSLLLLEDLDCLYGPDRKTKDAGVSLSGLLNAIDGPTAQVGRLLMMTTNHVDRLDAALVRPGRADVVIEFGQVTFEQAAEMHRRFYPDAEAWQRDEFAERAAGRMTASDVQQALMGVPR